MSFHKDILYMSISVHLSLCISFSWRTC